MVAKSEVDWGHLTMFSNPEFFLMNNIALFFSFLLSGLLSEHLVSGNQ